MPAIFSQAQLIKKSVTCFALAFAINCSADTIFGAHAPMESFLDNTLHVGDGPCQARATYGVSPAHRYLANTIPGSDGSKKTIAQEEARLKKHAQVRTDLVQPTDSLTCVGSLAFNFGKSLVVLNPNSRFTTCRLENRNNEPISPMAVLSVKNDLYFLGPDCIWIGHNSTNYLGTSNVIQAGKAKPPPGLYKEFNSFVYVAARHSIVILDKSGDLIEFSLHSQRWREYWPNVPLTRQPDPDFIDICLIGNALCLLDPERNQLWLINHPHGTARPCFKEVLPWKTKYHDQNFSQALAIVSDGRDLYILDKNGLITKYSGSRPHLGSHNVIHYHCAGRMRPSRLVSGEDTPLYMVERENNRVVAIDKKTLRSSQFLFPVDSDLRGLIPQASGFWIINGSSLAYRTLASADPFNVSPQPRCIDSRLNGLILPVAGTRLPRHPGVYPGARRLYRYGVHEGIDFFNDPGSKGKIVMGTPVRAAGAGTVIRADAKFKDMDWVQFARVMRECRTEHRTSKHNEDLFRGCQVWIAHGNSLVTRYAHLNKINMVLRKGLYVPRGGLIGYVGVSGTGQNLPGKSKFPHLHFEIWLDGKYLGWGLNPAEAIAVYEKVFSGSVTR